MLVTGAWQRGQPYVIPKPTATGPLDGVRGRIRHLTLGRRDLERRIVIHLPDYHLEAACPGELPKQVSTAVEDEEIVCRRYN